MSLADSFGYFFTAKISRILLLVLALKPPNHVTSHLYLNLCTGSKLMNELTKLLSLTYKVLTTTQPSYLHNLSLSNLLAVLVLPLLLLIVRLLKRRQTHSGCLVLSCYICLSRAKILCGPLRCLVVPVGFYMFYISFAWKGNNLLFY